MNNDGKVLFNEKCSICNFEIKHYKKRSELDFTDCSHMEDKYLKKLHVTFDDGKELVGVDAFIYVWNRTKGYRWLGTLVALNHQYVCTSCLHLNKIIKWCIAGSRWCPITTATLYIPGRLTIRPC